MRRPPDSKRAIMRIGNNPMRGKPLQHTMPGEVATVTTHLPNQEGYHAQRLEVVQTCLKSMRNGANVPVMVWDNGSCQELRDWLLDDYRPDFLVLSDNVGVHNAQKSIANLFPPETIIGFSDDDMLFWRGWWSESIRLLKGFPNVGMVSAWYARTATKWGINSTLEWAGGEALVECGNFTPIEHEIDYARSVGLQVDPHITRISSLCDYKITYKGMTCYASAQHCQFITRAGVIGKYFHWSDQAMLGQKELDERVDAGGYLRLTTSTRLALHMGNVIDDELRERIGDAFGTVMV